MDHIKEKTAPASGPEVLRGHFNPVNIKIDNALGTLLLGILAIILLIGWMKAEARNRQIVDSKP